MKTGKIIMGVFGLEDKLPVANPIELAEDVAMYMEVLDQKGRDTKFERDFYAAMQERYGSQRICESSDQLAIGFFTTMRMEQCLDELRYDSDF